MIKLSDILIKANVHFDSYNERTDNKVTIGFKSFIDSEKARATLESEGHSLVMSSKKEGLYLDTYNI